MPNWCATSIVFYSFDRGQIEKLHKIIFEMNKTGRIENGFGNLWLGNFVDKCGLDYNDVYCRGMITYFDDARVDDDGRWYLIIYQDDAWYPITEVWDLFLAWCCPDVKYVYCAEEPGCEIYINTDTSGLFFSDKYMVEWYDEDDWITDSDYLESDDALLSFAKEMGFETNSVSDALEYLDSRNDVVVHRFLPKE